MVVLEKQKSFIQKQLYHKLPVDIRNGSNEFFDNFSLTISNVLTGLEFVTEEEEKSIHYGKGRKGNEIRDVPFEVHYTTPNTICFSRNAIEPSKTIRTVDWWLLNQSIFGNDLYRNAHFKMYFHYPGQLLRTFHNPFFETNVLLGSKNNEEKVWDKIFKIKIEEVTVLRKRHDSNIPCKHHLNQLDDVNFMEEIMNRVGCMPIYWKDIRGISIRRECESPSDLKQIYQFIQNYKDVLLSYDGPCIEMSVTNKFDKEEENKWEEPLIKVVYTKSTYQNIENTRSFGFESFLSGVGGFIGIFLGYSILQIPELLGSVLARLRNIKMMGSNKNAINPNIVKKRRREQQHNNRSTTTTQTQLRKLLKRLIETQKKVVETRNKGIETQNQVEELQNAILQM